MVYVWYAIVLLTLWNPVQTGTRRMLLHVHFLNSTKLRWLEYLLACHCLVLQKSHNAWDGEGRGERGEAIGGGRKSLTADYLMTWKKSFQKNYLSLAFNWHNRCTTPQRQRQEMNALLSIKRYTRHTSKPFKRNRRTKKHFVSTDLKKVFFFIHRLQGSTGNLIKPRLASLLSTLCSSWCKLHVVVDGVTRHPRRWHE